MIDRDVIHRAAPSPLALAQSLGLTIDRGSRPERVKVLCPWHSEKKPSCTISIKDDRIFAHCFACGAGADLFGLVAVTNGLDHRHDFPRVAELAAELVGVSLSEPTRPIRQRPIVEDIAARIDSLADAWISGREVRPDHVIESATREQLAGAFDLLRIADEMDREARFEADAKLDAMADRVLARIAVREIMECM